MADAVLNQQNKNVYMQVLLIFYAITASDYTAVQSQKLLCCHNAQEFHLHISKSFAIKLCLGGLMLL